MMKWTLTTITAWKKFAESDFCQTVFSPHNNLNEPFLVFVMFWNFAWNWAKQSSLQGWVLHREHPKLSLAFFHCLCGCWCKGINLWPHQILAWMIMVCLFEQLCSAILVSKSSVMKSLKNSTGGVECSTYLLTYCPSCHRQLGQQQILSISGGLEPVSVRFPMNVP